MCVLAKSQTIPVALKDPLSVPAGRYVTEDAPEYYVKYDVAVDVVYSPLLICDGYLSFPLKNG